MNGRIRRTALWLAILILVGGGFGASAGAAEPIKIGSFLAVTGQASFLGDPEKKTLELYVDAINAKGGVLGRPLQLISYDTASDPDRAATLTRRLIEDDKVDFLVGGTTTADTMAATLWLSVRHIPFISLGGASVIVDPVNPWIFKTPHTDRLAVEKVYADMKQRGLSRVGLIAGDGGFDKSCIANAEDSNILNSYGVKVVGAETYGRDDKDVTPQLTKLKNAPGIQAVFFCGFGAPSVIVIKNFRQLGIAVPLYLSHGAASKQVIAGAGAVAAEGVRLPAAAVLVAGQLPASDPLRATGLAYAKAYEARYHEAISTFGGHAYDALMLMVEAIRRAESTDRTKVRAALEGIRNFVGVDGIYSMSPADHVGLDPSSMKMVEIHDGDWKLLY